MNPSEDSEPDDSESENLFSEGVREDREEEEGGSRVRWVRSLCFLTAGGELECVARDGKNFDEDGLGTGRDLGAERGVGSLLCLGVGLGLDGFFKNGLTGGEDEDGVEGRTRTCQAISFPLMNKNMVKPPQTFRYSRSLLALLYLLPLG